jgi:hypothetical protein
VEGLGEGVGGEGEVGELRADAYVPVDVVFENQGGGEVTLDDSEGGC